MFGGFPRLLLYLLCVRCFVGFVRLGCRVLKACKACDYPRCGAHGFQRAPGEEGDRGLDWGLDAM